MSLLFQGDLKQESRSVLQDEPEIFDVVLFVCSAVASGSDQVTTAHRSRSAGKCQKVS